MRKISLVLIIAVIAIPVFGKDLKQFQKEISSNNTSLKQIHKTISEKQAEKERAALDEKKIRSEINKIEKELDKLQNDGEKIRKKIIKAERNLQEARRRYQAATGVKEQRHSSLSSEVDYWYRAHLTNATLSPDIVGDELRLQAIKQKGILFADAKTKEAMIAQYMNRLRQAENNLIELKTSQERTLSRQMQVRKEKQEFLKTATGRRVVAQEEITRLKESAKALENLINALINEKKKSEAELAAANAEKNKRKHKSNPQIRGAIRRVPWPLSGKVIANFGKYKHPEFETIVVSNGIKIDSTPKAEVKCVYKGDVIFSGEFRAYGNMIIVDHQEEFYTIYGQLGSLAVEEGAKVKQGDVIASLGATEHILYFEIRRGNQPEDPLPWLK